jgi:tetratricopeptide (TPR) repeat protein
LNDQLIRQVNDLYQRGLYVQALQCGEQGAPIREWSGTQQRLLAGRIAYNLGAPRLGRAMHWLAWRHDPGDPMAIYFQALGVAAFHGPLRAWEMQERQGDLPEAEDGVHADYCALRARTFGMLRDFDTAESWSARAFELAPDRSWLYVEKTSLLSMQDRYDEALAAARRALELRPMYRPAVEAVSETLQALGRDEDALALLAEASQQLESANVLIQYAHLLSELDRHREARSVLERAPDLLPLMESHYEEWLTARRSDLAYLCGDIDAAFELARQGKDAFFKGRRDAL